MAIFSTNQNRQFYVVKRIVTVTPTQEGDIQVSKTADGEIFFKHFGKAGITRTDLINPDTSCYARLTRKAEMQRKTKKATVTLDPSVGGGAPIAGQDYVLRIYINNFLAPGDANTYVKVGAVHAVSGMTAATFYQKMAEVLTKSFSRESENGGLLTFSHSAAGLVIEEVKDQPWRLGVLSQEPVNFEVYPTTVTYEGSEVVWGKVTMADTNVTVGNGKKIADLEYFCQAERGDMFRNMGWPNNIDVKYMVDPSKEYDVLDLHYFYSGAGVQVHKSEKDITFVGEANITSLIDAIQAQASGITVKELKNNKIVDYKKA